MSRTDTDDPTTGATGPRADGIEVVTPREVVLGGLRAMTVRRTLPNRQRTTIGPWCFLDHYGPDDVDKTGGMRVPPHPHTGLQTVSWLFDGAVEHRDSTGANAIVRPGELNIMTAGWGIQHSEVSTADTTILHGIQLWVALPRKHRDQSPHFDARPSQVTTLGDAEVRLITGTLTEVGTVDAPEYWPMVAAQIDLPAHGHTTVTFSREYEHGILVDQGHTVLDGTPIPLHHLAYLPPEHVSIELHAGPVGARVVLIGGKPFEEDIVMWWNFVGTSHDDVVAARETWQGGLNDGSDRFGYLDHVPALPAPEMPRLSLRPRGPGAKAASSNQA